jgi:hypothetical protein
MARKACFPGLRNLSVVSTANGKCVPLTDAAGAGR